MAIAYNGCSMITLKLDVNASAILLRWRQSSRALTQSYAHSPRYKYKVSFLSETTEYVPDSVPERHILPMLKCRDPGYSRCHPTFSLCSVLCSQTPTATLTCSGRFLLLLDRIFRLSQGWLEVLAHRLRKGRQTEPGLDKSSKNSTLSFLDHTSLFQ